MILDSQTNFLYLADTLKHKYPQFYTNLIAALEANKIPYDFIPNTKDVWAVDYMPIQVSEHTFVRFTYTPDYLLTSKKKRATLTDVDAACEILGISTTNSDIILDGGNLTKGTNHLIMTTKIFIENKRIPELELMEQLKNLLEIDCITFIPTDDDFLGHADGMVRFVSDSKVFVNDTQALAMKDYINLHAALRNVNLELIPFPIRFSHTNLDDATGLYLNYLELQDFIIAPVFNFKEDEEAIFLLNQYFPSKTIIPVMSNEIAKDAGVINCCTWNVLK